MTFFACFDECGDEGFTFRGDGIKASSEWFILAAAVQTGQGTTPWITQHYADFRAKYRKQDKWHFHFVDASHEERLGFIEHMRVAPYACMAVAVHKPSLLLTDAFKKPYYLYFYTARLLLERVSWFCRFNKPANDTGPSTARLIFSSRRGLRVEDINEYLDLLRRKTEPRSLYADLAHNKIHWPALERGVEVKQNKELIGLQLADAMASSFGKAIEPSQYYTTECRYIRHLKPIVFRRHKSYLSYGIKFFPRLPDYIREQERFEWLGHFA